MGHPPRMTASQVGHDLEHCQYPRKGISLLEGCHPFPEIFIQRGSFSKDIVCMQDAPVKIRCAPLAMATISKRSETKLRY
jgi:hypothetical protein